jgi:ATP-dependent DNA ligase
MCAFFYCFVNEMDRFVISKYIKTNGKALYQVVEQQKLEGIVQRKRIASIELILSI